MWISENPYNEHTDKECIFSWFSILFSKSPCWIFYGQFIKMAKLKVKLFSVFRGLSSAEPHSMWVRVNIHIDNVENILTDK